MLMLLLFFLSFLFFSSISFLIYKLFNVIQRFCSVRLRLCFNIYISIIVIVKMLLIFHLLFIYFLSFCCVQCLHWNKQFFSSRCAECYMLLYIVQYVQHHLYRNKWQSVLLLSSLYCIVHPHKHRISMNNLLFAFLKFAFFSFYLTAIRLSYCFLLHIHASVSVCSFLVIKTQRESSDFELSRLENSFNEMKRKIKRRKCVCCWFFCYCFSMCMTLPKINIFFMFSAQLEKSAKSR